MLGPEKRDNVVSYTFYTTFSFRDIIVSFFCFAFNLGKNLEVWCNDDSKPQEVAQLTMLIGYAMQVTIIVPFLIAEIAIEVLAC